MAREGARIAKKNSATIVAADDDHNNNNGDFHTDEDDCYDYYNDSRS